MDKWSFEIGIVVFLAIAIGGGFVANALPGQQSPANKRTSAAVAEVLEDPIWEVSGELGMIRLQFVSAGRSVCMWDDAEGEALTRIIQDDRDACAALRAAWPHANATFERIGQSGVLERPLYLYELLVSGYPNGSSELVYSPTRVGVFSDAAVCREMEDTARGLGLTTRPCAEWQSIGERYGTATPGA